MTIEVYLSLGSNIGEKKLYLQKALIQIGKLKETEVIKFSSLYITEPWGKTDQDEFLNQVIQIKTSLPAIDLLHSLQKIEINMGRHRSEKWGPRRIDIDILLYGDQVIHTEELKVPHPFMKQRLFVLVPLEEINQNVIFPDDGTKIQEVLTTVLRQEETHSLKRL
ncbi:MAG TPA: 2-amino-4-hydroxy-6-hydroxymethyldihydropteridine diphosphokinase [Syntrophomonadaceae bacterium]|nr:2-amino-4-hydroxy-6-hydroxymethyldihydropteridine diphosphokinase [Syntrophomonadaceae bacterium]